jgi:trans-2,3-dihydro-3-hydroxyanthranilate isomerase
MTLSYCTLDVFTDHPFGGNPLAVFCDVPELPTDFMQNIAREFNLSETVFIVRPRNPRAARRLRIFTPARELPFAGHPTIGAALVVVEEGLAGISGSSGSFLLEEDVGLVPIHVKRQENGAWFIQFTAAKLPEECATAPPVPELARLLGIAPSDFAGGIHSAQAFSCGVPFLFVPLRDRKALGRVSIDPAESRKLHARGGFSQVFAFCNDPEREGSDIRARMFAHEFGISEDPATGSAAAAFAGYLVRRASRKEGTLRWTIEQGFEMGRPSIMYLEADVANGALTAVRVGGTAVRMSEGTLTAFRVMG